MASRLERIARAGQRALRDLTAARDELDQAEGAGILDLIGMGSIDDLVLGAAKYEHVRGAAKALERAKASLTTFARLLADSTAFVETNVDVDDLVAFADIFLDDIVPDALALGEIDDAKEQVEQAIEQVEELLDELAIAGEDEDNF